MLHIQSDIKKDERERPFHHEYSTDSVLQNIATHLSNVTTITIKTIYFRAKLLKELIIKPWKVYLQKELKFRVTFSQ